MGRPAQRRLNTRIVLVHYPDDAGQLHLLGLIVERATETVRRDLGDFVPSGLTNDAAPYLGPVATDARGWLQWIDVAKYHASMVDAFQTAGLRAVPASACKLQRASSPTERGEWPSPTLAKAKVC